MSEDRILRKSEKIATVAERWRTAYFNQNTVTHTFRHQGWIGSDKEATYHLLKMAKTEDEIASVIGNRSWTENKCDQCNRDAGLLIEVGEPSDWESRTANLCIDCVRTALASLEAIQ